MNRLCRIAQHPATAAAAAAATFLAALSLQLLHHYPQLQEIAALAKLSRRESPGASWTFKNPELDLMISELKKEKDRLALRDADLQALGARLEAERAEINLVMSNVQRMQSEFDSLVVRIQAEEIPNLKRLAKTYSSMEPVSAAAILESLPEDSIVRILMHMRETDCAAILASMAGQSPDQAKRVAELSERLRLSIASRSQ